MIQRLSLGTSILLHFAVILLVSLAVIRTEVPIEQQRGMEFEIVDVEHSMPSPNPQFASATQRQVDTPAEVERLESAPGSSTVSPVARAPSALRKLSVPNKEAAVSERTLGPAPVDPINVATRRSSDISNLNAVPPDIPRPTIQPTDNTGIDVGALSASLGEPESTRNQTRLNSAALGSVVGRATPKGIAGLTVRQRADLALMVRSQVMPCWNPPSSEAPSGASATLRFRLDRDGSVVGQPVLAGSNEGGASAAYVNLLANSGRRAVLLCSPLELPSELYDAWSEVEVEFDPRNTR